jgi:plastocyanin
MRQFLPSSIVAVALSMIGLALAQSAAAADAVKSIDIVKNADGKFVFSDTNAKIAAGQSVKWVAKDADVPHQLVPDTDKDALKDTGEFDSTKAPTQKFGAAGTIKYHCAIHPSMKGTITVTAAASEEPPAKAPVKKAPVKKAPPPSYDPY